MKWVSLQWLCFGARGTLSFVAFEIGRLKASWVGVSVLGEGKADAEGTRQYERLLLEMTHK